MEHWLERKGGLNEWTSEGIYNSSTSATRVCDELNWEFLVRMSIKLSTNDRSPITVSRPC